MTEKRYDFGGTFEEPTIKDTVSGAEYPSENFSLLDLINGLYDETMRLKSEYMVLHEQFRELNRFVENNFNEYQTREKLNRRITELEKENVELTEAIIGKIQYDEDLERFAVEKGMISKDWARFDCYD